MSENQSIRVKAAKTTFEILDALKELNGARVTELSSHLNLPKSTVHDHLSTLLEMNCIVKEDKQYIVGTKFLDYGCYARESMKVYQIARPVVNRLADDTGEHANLMIEEHGLGVFLYKSTGEDAVKLDTHPGLRVPLQTTAMGKAIMAHYSHERITEILNEHGLPEISENTITDRDELFDELEQVREQGYATDDQERVDGMRCVAAPVMWNEEVVAAVSVSGPVGRMEGERFAEAIPREVLSAANVIEVNMTYS